MQAMKKAFVVGAGLVTLGAGSLGVASAATADTSSTASGDTSLVQKIATKFGLKTSDVQAVFDEDRASHMAEMKEKRATALKQAVTDGKLTQAQADHITAVWDEIDKLHEAAGDPDNETDAQRTVIKTKMDELKTWLDGQNLDLSEIDGLDGRGGRGGSGGPRDDDSSNSSSSTSSES